MTEKEKFEEAKRLYQTANVAQKYILEKLFPQLKESENEKIKKDLIKWINEFPDIIWRGHHVKDVAAWLKKQAPNPQKKSEIIQDTWYICTCTTCSEDSRIWFKKGTAYLGKEILKYDLGFEPNDYQDYFRLWTIQDANDCDVLVTKSGRPFIFKGLLDKFHTKSPVAYCGIATTDDFFLSTGGGRWTEEEVYPATKEQHELLFAEMNKAGYEWDAKKKELKKIETSEECLCISPDEYNKFVNEFWQRKKSKWTEEDEKMMNDIIAAIDTLYYHGMVNWLKSLKDRVQPQLQPTWSEEDEKMLNRLIGVLDSTNKEDYHEGWEEIFLPWLKSLKDIVQPQNMWKPSKEQIIALRWVLNNIPYNKHKEEISVLLDQIKDL